MLVSANQAVIKVSSMMSSSHLKRNPCVLDLCYVSLDKLIYFHDSMSNSAVRLALEPLCCLSRTEDFQIAAFFLATAGLLMH